MGIDHGNKMEPSKTMEGGADSSLEQFSRPLRAEKTKCGEIFWLNPRKSKPGREFVPLYDERFPFVEDFKAKFLYYSNFLEKDNASGNHYHKIKQEIMIPLSGNFELHLVDINSKESEMITLDSKDGVSFYVRTGIAHKVVSRGDRGILLVIASTPSSNEDEIEYKID